jgi:hypothetical protein
MSRREAASAGAKPASMTRRDKLKLIERAPDRVPA